MIEICPACGTIYDTDTGCPICNPRYRRAFERAQKRLRLRRWFAELRRALHRSRLLAAVARLLQLAWEAELLKSDDVQARPSAPSAETITA